MAKATPFLSSCNAGEFSPRMAARVDFDKYPAAIARGHNLICLPQGGVTFRPGTRFVHATKTQVENSYLLEFEPVAQRSYIIEAGELYFRFYRNQGQMVAPEVATVITNGTFTSDISGWTNRSTGGCAIAYSAGRLALQGSADGFAWAEQALSVAAGDIGVSHVIRFEIGGNPNSKVTVQVGTASLGRDLFHASGLMPGWHTIGVDPTLATMYLQFLNENGDTCYIDNVEVLSDEAIELTSPYAAADIPGIRTTQSGDILYLFSGDYPAYKLERRGDTSWALVRAFFSDGPWLAINPDTDLHATNLVTNGGFDGGIAGWTESISSNAYVDFDGSQKVVFLRRFDTAGSAAIRQPVATAAANDVHVIHFQIVGGGTISFSIGTSAGATDIQGTTTLNAGWYSYSFTPGVTTFHLQFIANQDDAIVGGVGAVFCYTTNARLLAASAQTGSITITAQGDFAPFQSTDQGRLIRLEFPGREPGWAYITSVTSSQIVTAWVIRKIPSTVATESWRLGAWSDTTGWPQVATFYQQRLIAARTIAQPQTIWGSQTADFDNMQPDSWVEGATTVEDDDGLNFTLASTRVSPIVWLSGSRRLLVGTATGQWAIASRGPALTPSDFAAEPQTSIAAAEISPIQIDSVVLFTHRSLRRIYDIGFNYEIDGFQGADLTILADHIAREKIAQIAYQAEPFSNLWARLENGKLACLTYKRSQNVIGWTPADIAPSSAGDAVVESIAIIPGEDDDDQVYPSGDRDEVWMIVKRTIGGVTTRYIEVMEGFFDGPNRDEYLDKDEWTEALLEMQGDAIYLDCCHTYDGASTSTVTGLEALEGEEVMILADGGVQGPKTVASGEIDLDTAASLVHVGLSYDWNYKSLKLPHGSQTGSAVAQTKAVNPVSVVLRDAAGFEAAVDIDGDIQWIDVGFRDASVPMGTPTPLFTGEYKIDVDPGYDSDPRVVLRGSSPLPWTMLGIAPEVKTNQK